jgi:hypothetical protein
MIGILGLKKRENLGKVKLSHRRTFYARELKKSDYYPGCPT